MTRISRALGASKGAKIANYPSFLHLGKVLNSLGIFLGRKFHSIMPIDGKASQFIIILLLFCDYSKVLS